MPVRVNLGPRLYVLMYSTVQLLPIYEGNHEGANLSLTLGGITFADSKDGGFADATRARRSRFALRLLFMLLTRPPTYVSSTSTGPASFSNVPLAIAARIRRSMNQA